MAPSVRGVRIGTGTERCMAPSEARFEALRTLSHAFHRACLGGATTDSYFVAHPVAADRRPPRHKAQERSGDTSHLGSPICSKRLHTVLKALCSKRVVRH